MNEAEVKDSIINAAVYIGNKVYSQPYTDKRGRLVAANFTYTCSDGTVIHRPNHNMANTLRTLSNLNPVLEYLKSNGNEKTQKLMDSLDENDIEKLSYMSLFFTSGRNNEVGFLEDPIIAARAREVAGENFIAYFDQKLSDAEPIAPFSNREEVVQYAVILDKIYDGYDDLDYEDTDKNKAFRLVLNLSHEIDLLRCTPEIKFNKTIMKSLNNVSKKADNRDMQKLVIYAQESIIQTGDCLRTEYTTDDIHGVHEKTSFYLRLKAKGLHFIRTGNFSIVLGARARNDLLFKEASKVDKEGIKKTLGKLSEVVKPVFFQANDIDTQVDGEAVLKLIESGNAMSRTINGSLTSKTSRFELEQLVNPNYVRPMRKSLLKQSHKYLIDLETKKINSLESKNYIPISEQNEVITPPPTIPIDKKIYSKQDDRGKPKKTIFQKKVSFSLVPKSGLFKMFTGRDQDYIKPGFVAVGLLHDAQKMHLHGERYMWTDDVRSSGINGYFWLTDNLSTSRTTFFPGLQDIRNNSYCKNFNDLQKKVNTQGTDIKYSEILAGGSIKSLSAIYSVSSDSVCLLAAMRLQSMLKYDYNVERPIILMDGKNEPKIYSKTELDIFFKQVIKNQNTWFRRLLNWFMPSNEIKLIRVIEKMRNAEPDTNTKVNAFSELGSSVSQSNNNPSLDSSNMSPKQQKELEAVKEEGNKTVELKEREVGDVHHPVTSNRMGS